MNSNWVPGVAAVMGLALAGAPSVDARDIYERGGRGRDVRYETYAGRIGFEKGYEDGLERGRDDGEDGDRYDVTRHGRYRDGDHGYRRSYGPRLEYVRSYRGGFEQGYRDGFAPYARGRAGRAVGRGRYGARDGGYYGRSGAYAQYPFDAYDYQRNGRHRHEGRSGWCAADHRYDERGRIYEVPRR
jgi:hypothetical protein